MHNSEKLGPFDVLYMFEFEYETTLLFSEQWIKNIYRNDTKGAEKETPKTGWELASDVDPEI